MDRMVGKADFTLPVNPLVTVVIAAYNYESFVSDAIDSVLDQSHGNLEIIVIDDGSTDGTWDLLAAYGTRIRAVRQENSGVSGARNLGILLSEGELITFLDADDIMHPGKIESQLLFLRKNPAAAAVFSNYVNFRGEEVSSTTHFERCPRLRGMFSGDCSQEILLNQESFRDLMAKENFTSACTVLFHRKALKMAGLFDTDLSQGEDFELFYRIARYYPIGIINSVLVKRRLHKSNATSRRIDLETKAGRSREKILGYETDPVIRKSLKRWLIRLYLELGDHLAVKDFNQAVRLTMHCLKFGHPFRKKVLRNLIKALICRFCPSILGKDKQPSEAVEIKTDLLEN